ncbi:aminopeptidase [bacterium]|nr:aminopeptidase [candidate division CSSED10-310 bacterium]
MSVFWDDDIRLDRWARVIVDFCTNIKKGERVDISGEYDGHPLLLALYRRCLEVGSHPVLRPIIPESAEIYYSIASDEQLSHVHKIDLYTLRHTDVSLHVMAESNTKSLNWVEPGKMSKVRLARKELGKIRKERVRWNVTSYPTDAYAQDAGMSLIEFRDFIYDAGFLNHEDALARWQRLRDRQQAMTKVLQNTHFFRIESDTCDLRLGVEGRRICESSGGVNMPDGEIYTGPQEIAVDGWIQFSFPGYYLGQIVHGIKLEFKKGRVVNASAEANEAFLLKMLDTDPGARHIGELGIGTNWGIQRFTQNMLFDEKMGGTIHLALGDAYRETLGKNRSAIHWDILHDLRENGRIYTDDTLFMENGKFVGKFAEIWENCI